MSGSMHLDGAEDVRRAASTMSGAAESMQSAANTFSEAVTGLRNQMWENESAMERHREFMEQWLTRFEAAVKKLTGPEIVGNVSLDEAMARGMLKDSGVV